MASRQSHRPDARPSSPLISTSPSATDRDFSLSASSKTIQSSLGLFNDYVRKYHERFVENESLERNRLIASFSEKGKSYEKQISKLKAVHIDIAGLLARERSTNNELRQKLDVAANSVARLCKVAADANFVFIDRKQSPHGIKQEEPSQESMSVTDMMLCPNAAISSLLSQIGSIVIEMNTQNGVGQAPPIDPSPCHSITEALSKVADFLLAAQRSFGLLLEDLKSVDTARGETEFQNRTLQEKIALLQEELEEKRRDNARISQELAQARLERENHICRTPVSVYPTPAAHDDFHGSLPSPPLEKRDLPTPDDILQDSYKITRKASPAPAERVIPGNATIPPPTPTAKAGPSPTSASTNGKRRKISVNQFAERLKAKPESPITQSGPSNPLSVRDDKQAAGPSMPPPTTPAQGMKRALSGAHKCQDISSKPPPILSISASSTSISDKTNTHRPHKKRRINVAPGASLKNKALNENPAVNANATHGPTPTTGPSASSSKHNTAQLPKTKASDLKSLKFNKVSQPKPLSAPALAMSSSINTPAKSDRPPVRPLGFANKSPQERAALRKAK